jgi:putative hydrolase of the HAD superfamily
MGAELVVHSIRQANFRDFLVVRLYRRLREDVGVREIAEFEEHIAARVASRFNLTPRQVQTIVAEWIEARPLIALAHYRYSGVDKVFSSARSSGRKIGVFSDYPAGEKLMSLGLKADFAVSARDVNALKPNPRGLELIMEKAGENQNSTVLIGDRPELDGEAARRAGVRFLLRSSKQLESWTCFSSYSDCLFAGLHAGV